ncbi:MAG: 50S ribosomal protein L5 [Omnitrophica bacterium GWA2_52_12]|nr:MAG: 50S ribosomal protein L5 [Omnitrophica bacterium GWA2_52_12]
MTNVANKAPNLLVKYRKEVSPVLMKEFEYSNIMEVPRLDKVVINMGIKEGREDVKVLEHVVGELAQISGQKPLVTKAKKSISSFKLRQGQSIGAKVTLRRARMYEFLDRLFTIAMPRIRDFRGYSDRSFDGRGNYTLGIQEQIIFPEVEFDKVKKTQGMDVTFVTTAKTDEEAKRLLELLGLPFIKKQQAETQGAQAHG